MTTFIHFNDYTIFMLTLCNVTDKIMKKKSKALKKKKNSYFGFFFKKKKYIQKQKKSDTCYLK